MNPKEKAEQLVEKYLENIEDSTGTFLLSKYSAKQCASLENKSTHIAIAKFLQSIARNLPFGQPAQLGKQQLEKYNSIEEEIKKL